MLKGQRPLLSWTRRVKLASQHLPVATSQLADRATRGSGRGHELMANLQRMLARRKDSGFNLTQILQRARVLCPERGKKIRVEFL